MLSTLRFIVTVICGVALGLASAWWALTAPALDFTQRIGAWTMVGGGDPYTSARQARDGQTAMPASEGVMLITDRDSDGRQLDPACVYRLEGPLPPDILWTLTLSDHLGHLPVNPAGRFGFTSTDAFRYGPTGALSISIGPGVEPGNFIPVGGLQTLILTLRLYGTQVAGQIRDAGSLPLVVKLHCGEEQK